MLAASSSVVSRSGSWASTVSGSKVERTQRLTDLGLGEGYAARWHDVPTPPSQPWDRGVPGDDLCRGVEEHRWWGTNDSEFQPGGSAC